MATPLSETTWYPFFWKLGGTNGDLILPFGWNSQTRVVADVLGRETLLLEVRHQLAKRLGVHHRTGEHVVADVGALLEHEHAGIFDLRLAGLLGLAVERLDLAHQMDCGRQRGGARPDVEDVDLHAFSFDLSHRVLSFSVSCRGSTLGEGSIGVELDPSGDVPAGPSAAALYFGR